MRKKNKGRVERGKVDRKRSEGEGKGEGKWVCAVVKVV